MPAESAIEGKVANVQLDGRVIINVGIDKKVSEGMTFIVLAGNSIEIIDPVSKQSLGKMEDEKLRLTVEVVYPKFSVCRAAGSRSVVPGSVYSAGAPGPFLSGYVKVGDDVKQWIQPTR